MLLRTGDVMEQIRKDYAIAAIVRTFFKYFTLGVIESQPDGGSADSYEPRNVKRAMLNHYEKIAPAFNNEAFYAIFQMNYEEEEAETVLRGFVTSGTSLMDLVRLACRSEELYSAMVSEYKHNFELLLCGEMAGLSGQDTLLNPCPSAGEMDMAKAERIINALASKAYEQGKNMVSHS